MAIEFRCEKCGKLLNVEAEPASRIKCPYCKAKVQVPAGVASLPRPQVPAGAMAPAGAAAGGKPAGGQPGQEVQEEEGNDAFMGVMAGFMPWVISLFFHTGVVVVLAFFTIMTARVVGTADITVPDADLPMGEKVGPPGGVLNPGAGDPTLQAKSLNKVDNHGWAQHDSKIMGAGEQDKGGVGMGDTDGAISLYGMGGGGGGGGGGTTADFGLVSGGNGIGPKSRFFGVGGGVNAYHIVYCVDMSGSMLESFDLIRRELLKSISRLSPAQSFHVVLFSSAGATKESPPRRLVFADDNNKREANEFLKTIQPHGGSPTVPSDAIKRSFEVLRSAPGNKKGKMLYCLTDGEFDDNNRVRAEIKQLNSDKSVHVNMLLYVFRSPEMEKWMQEVSAENDGKYKFVERSE